ncbi:hypothetical protein FSP39_019556 [Pinctada imbricata]|uniref:ABC transporter domain-containing protein n=1 Tax=Pinctada imbricata TaxID=66713 RepID=A0AA88XGD5_PINIB|nr:hypothetical protein FSP39_019556 [Pinctada imbricata]
MANRAADSRLIFENVRASIKTKEILHGISGIATCGKLLAIMGPTGSGKTTLLNVLAGHIPKVSGSITLDGVPLRKASRRKVAYVIQNDIFLTNLTLYETLYEPTSGLDSSTAYKLMQQLVTYATNFNKTIVTTIHQPSSQIHHLFWTLLLLENGRTAYFGKASDVVTYFEDLGFPCQPDYNPADYCPQAYNKDMTTKETTKAGEQTARVWPNSFWAQYKILTWRNYRQAKGRIIDRKTTIQALIVGLVGGLVYFQIPDTLDTFRDRMGLLFATVLHWGMQVAVVTIIGSGFYSTHLPPSLNWMKYFSLMHYPIAAMTTIILADREIFPCNETSLETFKLCEKSEFLSKEELLASYGIEVPVHCCLSMLAILIVLAKVLGYFALKWKHV